MSTNNNRLIFHGTLAFGATLWLGLLFGVSFLATPVKFAAPTLTLPVGLDVGRVTFALFNKVEWAMAALVAIVFLFAGMRRISLVLLAASIGILGLQQFWLRPILDVRIAAAIAGTPMPQTYHHVAYVAFEVAKAVSLLGLAILTFRHLIQLSKRTSIATTLSGSASRANCERV